MGAQETAFRAGRTSPSENAGMGRELKLNHLDRVSEQQSHVLCNPRGLESKWKGPSQHVDHRDS